ncbi:MAG: M50 family metallopeptidase [Archangium sp.]
MGALFFGGFAVRPAFWAGFVLLVLVHELGHAWMVKRAGAEVLAVELSALGGVCRWSGEVTRVQRACIAWAGVWAQALVFLAALTVQALEGTPTSESGRELLSVSLPRFAVGTKTRVPLQI